MGGEPERIRVMELGGKNEDVRVALNRFDAATAKCYREGDRQRLLAVVEAGFGDLHAFDEMVHGLFTEGAAKKAMLKEQGKAGAEEMVRV